MKDIFTEIQDRIAAKVSEVKWIDEDTGQLEGYYERPPVLFPCVLIDFNDTLFSDMGEGGQLADATVRLRVAFNPIHYTNSATPSPIKTKALERFDVLKKLHAALHGWSGTDFTTLSRISHKGERRDDPLKVYQVTYRLGYEEYIDDDATVQEPPEFEFQASS